MASIAGSVARPLEPLPLITNKLKMSSTTSSMPIERGGWNVPFLARRPVRDDVSPWLGFDKYVRTTFVVGAHPIVESMDGKGDDEVQEATLRNKLLDILDDADVQWSSLGVFRLGYPFENRGDVPVTLLITVIPDSTDVEFAMSIVRQLCVVLDT